MDEVGESLLDNPFWHAMVGPQRELALGSGLARRIQVLPVAALHCPDEAAFADLDALSVPGDELYVVMRAPLPVPERWTQDSIVEFDQYVCRRLTSTPTVEATWLGMDDLEDMMELVELTRPGPLFPGALALGRFLGIFEDGRLVAMAGERCHPPGFREISTVCTLPECRGRGLASGLTARLASEILASGETPFLHVASGNDAAARVYRRLGFTLRATVTLSHLCRTEALVPARAGSA